MVAAQFPSSAVVLVALFGFAAAFQPAENPQTFSTSPAATSLDAVSRREALAASTAAVAVPLFGVPLPALANPKDGGPNPALFSFNGVFKDRKHPDGYRTVAGVANKEGTIALKDDPEGDEYFIPFRAIKDEKTGRISLVVDFSSKGGPRDVLASVNRKDHSISFPDGNVWKKEPGVVGVYIDAFAPYPKYRRVIKQQIGSDLVLDMVSGKKTTTIYGKAGKNNVTVEFPGKTCQGDVDIKRGTITFPDGNIWTKV